MKKTKFLSLLVLAPLMTGCGNSVKAPKFSNKGEEIKKAEFQTALDKALAKASFANAGKKLGSGEYKTSFAYNETNEKIRGKKTLRKNVDFEKRSVDHLYDPGKLVDRFVTEYEQSRTSEDKTGKSVDEQSLKYENSYQFTKVGKKQYLIQVMKEAKEYIPLVETDKKTCLEAFDAGAKDYANGLFDDIHNMIDEYNAKKGKALKDYKFYKNENVFTIVFETEETDEFKSADTVIYKTTTKRSETIQVDTTEGKWSTKSYRHVEEDREFKENYYALAKGDVVHIVEDYATEASFELKEVKTEQFDISDFVGFGFEA